MRGLDRRGVEPLVLKIMAGLILLAVGLGIGLSMYYRIGPYAQQMLTYTVTVSPNSATVGRPVSGDNTVYVSVRVERLTDYDKRVSLSAVGLPTGVRVSFSPSDEVPDFGSTMRIDVSREAPLGVTTITIKARGADGTEKTAYFELTVS